MHTLCEPWRVIAIERNTQLSTKIDNLSIIEINTRLVLLLFSRYVHITKTVNPKYSIPIASLSWTHEGLIESGSQPYI